MTTKPKVRCLMSSCRARAEHDDGLCGYHHELSEDYSKPASNANRVHDERLYELMREFRFTIESGTKSMARMVELLAEIRDLLRETR